MDRIAALRVFARVAELGSFTRAAEALGLQKGAASTAVQQLESSLGARLFHRTTRRVQLTQDGRACYEKARDVLAELDDLQSMFRQAPRQLAGRLRVDLPTGLAKNFIVPRLPEFTRAHPAIQFELSATDRRVDLVREGFDCVLRVGPVVDDTLIAQRLGSLRVVTVASPAYLAEFGEPRTLDDLSRHRLVHYAATLGSRPDGWEYFDGTAYKVLPMQGVVTVNNVDAYQAACLAGYGLIQAPAVGVARDVAAGRLVEILGDHKAEAMPVTWLHAHRRHLPPRVRAFMDWVGEVLAPYLERDRVNAA